MKDSTVCPESTLESASVRNSVREPGLKQTGAKNNKLACESSIESANRRGFIKNAAMVTAAAAVGGTVRAKYLSSPEGSFRAAEAGRVG